MDHLSEAKLQKQIRKRAFERADILRQERQSHRKTQYTLDALREVTGLPRSQLEAIADQVTRSRQATNDDFFSIRNQILITLVFCGLILIFGWLVGAV